VALSGASISVQAADARNEKAPAASDNVNKAKVKATKRSGIALRKGMTSDEVRQSVGTPTTIEATKCPDGVAEVWTYRGVVDRKTRMVQPRIDTEMVFDSTTQQFQSRMAPAVTMIEEQDIEEVTTLLLVDGKLTAWRQARVAQQPQFH
jgi:hypothetical protein